MKRFKFAEKLFDMFFNMFYHDHDTYKETPIPSRPDLEGKGILERFLSIGAEYFDEEIVPDIDHIMDLSDPRKTPYEYIGFLWEFWGYIPYSYGLVKTGVPYSKDDLEQWIRNSRFPLADYRNLLKYAISLYKIKCTDQFYEVLSRLYNMRIVLVDKTAGQNKNEVWYDNDWVKYDENYKYDSPYDCLECLDLEVTTYIPRGVLEYLNGNDLMLSARDAIANTINKYLPIHVQEINPLDIIILEDLTTNTTIRMTASNL